MHDRRDDRSDRGRSRHEHHRDDRNRRGGDECRDGERGSHPQGDDDSGRDRAGRGPDTRFLQLEMSEVLYAEAESVTKEALRELLLEEAKARFRERFGDQIAGLAQLAVDELLQDVFASLDIEARIRDRNQDHEGRRERLSGILGGGRDDDGEPGPPDSDDDDGSERESE